MSETGNCYGCTNKTLMLLLLEETTSITLAWEWRIHALDLDFPDTPEIDYSDMMTVSQMLGIVDRLKETPPEDKDLQAASRWDEILTIVKANYPSLNSCKADA